MPGARIDSRAYAHVLRPLAEAGYLVAVLKEPFGFSLLDADQGKKVLDVHPEITYWAAGGHSLGGTTAASLADQDERVKGLVLFASYPADSLVRTDLKAVSISGAADGFTTPADIEASKGEASARYVLCRDQRGSAQLIGDYGEQSGDGIATVDRSAAQTEITTAALALLTSLTLLRRHLPRRSSPATGNGASRHVESP